MAEMLIERAVESLGGLDILITNAGGPPAGSFEIFDEQTWQKQWTRLLMSHVRLIRAALPHLRESEVAERADVHFLHGQTADAEFDPFEQRSRRNRRPDQVPGAGTWQGWDSF
jgi:NAD(P)-dependent dehydrogenase (short-subunit alcohol dehydrogenase family)